MSIQVNLTSVLEVKGLIESFDKEFIDVAFAPCANNTFGIRKHLESLPQP